jgi:hypothetical protein
MSNDLIDPHQYNCFSYKTFFISDEEESPASTNNTLSIELGSLSFFLPVQTLPLSSNGYSIINQKMLQQSHENNQKSREKLSCVKTNY